MSKLVYVSKYSLMPEATHFNGYWTNGHTVVDVSHGIHSRFIIDNPEKFGMTLEEITAIFEKHGENLNQEGKAREELIKLVSTKGWIRVRHYISPRDYWSIQCDKLKMRLASVREFIEWAMFDASVMKKNDELIILGYEDDYKETYAWSSDGAMGFFKAHPIEEKVNRVVESSLSRIWQHIRNPSSTCAFISAYTKDFTDKENHERHKELIRVVKQNYSYIHLLSGYEYEMEIPNQKKEVSLIEEESLFIYNISKYSAIHIGENFEQQSILYKDPTGFYLLKTTDGSGDVWERFKTKGELLSFDLSDIKNGYSSLIRANRSQRVNFSFLKEFLIPSREEARLWEGEGAVPGKWISVV